VHKSIAKIDFFFVSDWSKNQGTSSSGQTDESARGAAARRRRRLAASFVF